MSMQPPFFGKRPPDPITSRSQTTAGSTSSAGAGSAALHQGTPSTAPITPIAAVQPAAPVSGAPVKEGGSKLTVGPNIKLKGVEITDIDFAEIHGEFNGDLTVREKLVIYSTGRVSGKIRYGKVVIQEGGQLMGDVQFDAAKAGKAAGASILAG